MAFAHSVSIITPPAGTLKVSKEANEAGVPTIWLQPGSFDDEGLEYARAIICSLRVLSLGGGSG
jgi:predicted CoA-binding protein